MKERFIITTYDPNIVGSSPFSAGVIENAYYIGGNQFGFNKTDAMLFEDYRGAQTSIENSKIGYAQIEKVYIL